jgi:hypothetical protein
MMPKRTRWPTIDELVANAQRGILDDTEDALPPYELPEQEGVGKPQPEPQVPKRPARKRQKRSAA